MSHRLCLLQPASVVQIFSGLQKKHTHTKCMISGLNVTDKTAMTDITFGALGQGEHFMHWGLGQWLFALEVCPRMCILESVTT